MTDYQQFNIRLPRAALKKLRVYAADKDTKLQSIGVEALQMWAEKNGIDLSLIPTTTPPETQENTGDVALTGNETHPGMSSAIRV